MNTYPIKLREKALRLLDKGYTKEEVKELLDISCDSLERWENLRKETGSLKDNPPKRTVYKIDRDKLAKQNDYAMFLAGRYAVCA